jgi:uncharacterized protein YjlB
MTNGARIAVDAEEIEVTAHLFRDDGSIPNNPTLPLLLYPGALRLGSDPAADCEAVFAACGWGGTWRNGIYSYHHYHSTAHEVLAISRGEVRVKFGGENGVEVELHPGDVALIPAGVGHKNLGATRDLLVVGAYPPGQTWDLLRGDPGERPWAQQNIARVPLPTNDPVYGPVGPLHTHWHT